MHILALLSLLPCLTLAMPTHVKRQSGSPSCGAEWTIRQFTTFTAGNATPAGAPPAFSSDFISFYFDDATFNVSTLCDRSVEPGTGQLADGNAYPCGSNTFFSFFGDDVELKRTGVKCDNAIYTLSGGTGLSLECFPLFGGTECETPTGQIDVPVSFLEQTGP